MRRVKASWISTVLSGSALLAWAPGVHAQGSTTSAERKPGLVVCYIYSFIRHVDEIAHWEPA